MQYTQSPAPVDSPNAYNEPGYDPYDPRRASMPNMSPSTSPMPPAPWSARPASSYYHATLGPAITASPPAFPVPQIPESLMPGRGFRSHSVDENALTFTPPTSPSPTQGTFSSYGRPAPGFPRIFQSAPAVPQHVSPPHSPQIIHTSSYAPWDPSRTPTASTHPLLVPGGPGGFFHPNMPEQSHLNMPEASVYPPRHSSLPKADPIMQNSSPHLVKLEKARQASFDAQHVEPSLPTYIHPDDYDGEDDRAGLAEALAMSMAHDAEQDELARREEEELARALAASTLAEAEDPEDGGAMQITPIGITMPEPEPAPMDYSSSSGHTASDHSGSVSSSSHYYPTAMTSGASDDNGSAIWHAHRDAVLEQMRQDEELARRLAAEDEPVPSSSSKGPLPVFDQSEDQLPPPPYMGKKRLTLPDMPIAGVSPDTEVSPVPIIGRSQSATAMGLAWNSSSPMPQSSGSGKTRSHSIGAVPAPSWNGSDTASVRTSVFGTESYPPPPLSAVGEDEWETLEMPEGPSVTTPEPPPGPPEELLMGVTLGFGPPPISAVMQPLGGPFPNVMALPYGKCPPLHMQAPSWTRLLQLLARMGSCRIEPTVEALALRKDPDALRLRTVVQFVKVHREDANWRAVVYLTLDHILPRLLQPGTATPGAPAWKYVGDPGTLPYSYTLSPLPTLLQGPADGPLVRTYTIPATDRTPFPSLPLSLPNFVSYLHSALADSRAAAQDASGGLRRLARMIDECFPADRDTGNTEDDEDGSGRKKRLRSRIWGKFGKHNKARIGGNSDTYQIITPFLPEEG